MRSSGVLVPQRSLSVDEDGGSEERGADNVAGHAVATTLHDHVRQPAGQRPSGGRDEQRISSHNVQSASPFACDATPTLRGRGYAAYWTLVACRHDAGAGMLTFGGIGDGRHRRFDDYALRWSSRSHPSVAGRQDGRRRLERRRVGQGTGCRRLGRRTARNPEGAKNARSSSGRSAAFLSTDILI